MKVQVAEGLAGLWSLKDDWERLHAGTGAGLFQSHAWIAAWAGVIPNAADIRIVVVEDGGRSCILPLIVQRRLGIRRLRWLGREVTDYCDAIATEGWDIAALAAAVRDNLPSCDIVELGQIQAGSTAAQLFAARLGPDQHCPRIAVADAGFPKDILYAERRTAASGPLVHHVAATAIERSGIAAFVIDRKKRALVRQNRATAEFDTNVTPFLRRLAVLDYPAGTQPCFSSLMLDGQTIAAQIGFIENGTLLYYLPAFDFAFRSHSPGHLLILNLLREARRAGLETMDLLRGQEPYKFKWTNDAQSLAVAHWPCSLRGQAFGFAQRVKQGSGRTGERGVSDHP